MLGENEMKPNGRLQQNVRLSEWLGIAGAAATIAGLASTLVLGFDALLRTPAARPLRSLDI